MTFGMMSWCKRWASAVAGNGGLIAASLLFLGTTPAQAEETSWPARARTAAAYLDQEWGEPGDWRGIEAWQRFVVADALIDYQRRTGDGRWGKRVGTVVRNRKGLYLNDDDLWAVIANVHAWQVERDPALLDYATSTYRRIVSTYWDDKCGGGLWWDPARTYKNAITNELLIYASTQLYLATGEEGYRAWALRGWSWFEQSSMIGPDGLVNDGLDAACRNNGQPYFTYNQGVLLGGLSDLTRITGNPVYRAAAVRMALAVSHRLSGGTGVLREPVPIGSDGLMFKGIFAFHLGHLLEDMPAGPEREELLAWTRLNAQAVWQASASGTRPIGGDWSIPDSSSGPAAQASGSAMMLAAIG